MNNQTKVLIGSPIRQDPEILNKFLDSLKALEKTNLQIDCFFIDDNDNSSSRDLLFNFSKDFDGKIIIEQGEKIDTYIRSENTHFWKENLIWKVADYKNKIIAYSKKEAYDYLFLIDSDIIIHPKTLNHLINANKDIISEIFWTKWQKDSDELPQVWLYDQYSLVPKKRFENISQTESDNRYTDFLKQLRIPGIYEVGGLGACTLINRKALDIGVNFSEIYNLTFWGEDRHFCIRAAALGLKLYVDTTYPAYHIYRADCLNGVSEYKAKCKYDTNININTPIIDANASAVQFAASFIETFYTYDYREANRELVTKYFFPKFIHKLNEKKHSLIDSLYGKEIVYKPNNIVINTKYSKNISNRIELDCLFQILIDSNKESLKKNFGCQLVLEKQADDKWLISNIELRNSNNIPILGFSPLEILEEKERINKSENNKLTLTMLVRNEGEKFLRKVLSHVSQYVDNAVILDDASTDNTVEICKEILGGIPLTLISNKECQFNNEIALRKQLWQMTIDTKPDWILCLDADEIFEDRIVNTVKTLMNQPNFDYYAFRLYDMWDETHYREDNYWQAHRYFRPFLIRYQPNFNYIWQETPLHCGRLPQNIFSLPGSVCYIRLKHFGWSTRKLRENKYSRYLSLDPEGKYGIMDQYKSILDENPTLIEWE